VGFSQQVKYSFEEVSYTPGEKIKYVTVYSNDIDDVTGAPKYKVTATIDIKNKKLASNYVYLSENGSPGQLCMSTITHVGHLYLSTPNTGGVEAYACRNQFTNVVFYFLAGATTDDTLKFLIYVPSGPNGFQMAN
jgi:hypothetical protein